MYKDAKLEELYETVLKNKLGKNGYDIWDDEPLTEIKIQYFFNRLFETNLLLELFSEEGETNVIYENKPIKGGLEFKLENIINDIKFYTIITLYKCDFIINKLEYDILDELRIKGEAKDLNILKNYLEENKNKYVIAFRFEDENELKNITGQMANKASTVFSNVYRNIRYVTHKLNYLNNIAAYYCMVSKNELKRIKLYKEIMRRTTKFNNSYEDYNSNSEYVYLYFWG
jgi:hypothetical protein